MTWADGPLLAVDCESTGTDPLSARIVTCATVLVGPADAGPRRTDARTLARHGMPALHVGHVVDPLVIDRAVDKYRKGSRKLGPTCEHYRVALDGAHEAGADAIAAARLAWRLAQRFPALVGELSLAELHEAQIGWAKEWSSHFQEYLRTKGGQPDAVIDPSWPLRLPADGQEAAA